MSNWLFCPCIPGPSLVLFALLSLGYHTQGPINEFNCWVMSVESYFCLANLEVEDNLILLNESWVQSFPAHYGIFWDNE